MDFTYPGDTHLVFTSTQFDSFVGFEAGMKMFGSAGTGVMGYAGPIEIKSADPWAWQGTAATADGGKFAANGAFADNLEFADRDKERTFIASIVDGPAHNQIAAGVETALSCMLGRMAGYQKREVTWEELQAHGETYPLGFSVEQFA